MYTQLAARLVVVQNGLHVSQAVATEGANAASIETTVFAASGELQIYIRGSNDLENWVDLPFGAADTSPLISASAIGYFSETYFLDNSKTRRIAFAYVRLRYAQGDTGTIILAAGLNLFSA